MDTRNLAARLLSSLFFAVCVPVDCHDQKSDNGKENEYAHQTGPCSPFGIIRNAASFVSEFIHHIMRNRGQQGTNHDKTDSHRDHGGNSSID